MKLPMLIRTKQQLWKVLRLGPAENMVSWDEGGPCPYFCKTPAVELTIKQQEYVILTPRTHFLCLQRQFQCKEDAEKQVAEMAKQKKVAKQKKKEESNRQKRIRLGREANTRRPCNES